MLCPGVNATALLPARALKMALKALAKIRLGESGGRRELTPKLEDNGVSRLADLLLPVVEPSDVHRQAPVLARHRSPRRSPERNVPARPSGAAFRVANPWPER